MRRRLVADLQMYVWSACGVIATPLGDQLACGRHVVCRMQRRFGSSGRGGNGGGGGNRRAPIDQARSSSIHMGTAERVFRIVQVVYHLSSAAWLRYKTSFAMAEIISQHNPLLNTRS